MDGGIPVFTTATRAEAEQLQLRHCRLARDGSDTYRLNVCLGDALLEFEDLAFIGDMFRASHAGKPWEAEAELQKRVEARRQLTTGDRS